MGVGGNQRAVGNVVPEAQTVDVIFCATDGNLILIIK